MITIHMVAKACGVSTATVSHVIHKTRYVAPEVTQKVNQAIFDLGYTPLRKRKSITGTKLVGIFIYISEYSGGADFFAALSQSMEEQHIRPISIMIGASLSYKEFVEYSKIHKLDYAVIHSSVQLTKLGKSIPPIPTVILNTKDTGRQNLSIIHYDYTEAATQAVRHLINLGHTKIAVLDSVEENQVSRKFVLLMKSLSQEGLFHGAYKECFWELTKNITPHEAKEEFKKFFLNSPKVTAIISTEINATMNLLNYRNSQNPEIISNISLITMGDSSMLKVCFSQLARIDLDMKQLTDEIGRLLLQMGAGHIGERSSVSYSFSYGSSTSSLARDCLGNQADKLQKLEFDKYEIEQLQRSNYKIGISMHDASTMFSQLVLQGIKAICNGFGIQIATVQDAEQNYLIQEKQLKDMGNLPIDGLISISNDHTKVQDRLFSVSDKGKKLILGVDVPISLPGSSYTACVATNEPEKGRLAAKLLGTQMLKNGKSKIAFVCNSNINFSSTQRDSAAINTIIEEFPQLEMICRCDFIRESNALSIMQEMIESYPQIEGIYIFHANAAIEAQQYLRSIGRSDILIVTTQINYEIASMLSTDKNILGIISSQPYELGRGLGLAAAGSLLNKKMPQYVALEPISITAENLHHVWLKTARIQLPREG